MATYVKGNKVANATRYDLKEKLSDGSHKTLVEDAAEINFNVSALGLSAGDHTLVVVAQADNYADSDPSNEVVFPVTAGGDGGNTGGNSGGTTTGNVVFDFDFTTNNIDDYALSDIFTVPSGSNTAGIEYDSTKGMSLNGELPNGLNLINPIDASKAWTLEATGTFVTPTDLAGNRRAFLGGNDLYPFVFHNGGTVGQMGFQVSNGSHVYVGAGKLVYDTEVTYKVVYDGAGKLTITANGTEIGTATINMTGNFTVILGNVSGKSSAYVWKNVESGKKSYLKKFKFYYN